MKKRIMSLLICAALAMMPINAKEDVFLEGTKDVVTKELAKGSGVYHTNALISAGTKYNNKSADKEINIIEVDLSNTRVSIEALNCGKALANAVKLKTQTEQYAESFSDKTILAAVNGDLWMTAVHSNADVTKKTLKVSRGIMISDGEIWASEQIDMENELATNAERGTPSPPKAALGITDINQPVVGSPIINISFKNESTGEKFSADGLNRLPANDSLIVYNHRVLETNYALDDAYEIELETSDSAFTLDGTVRATVKAIYPEGSTVRPAIDENTILITARRDAIKEIKDKIKIGDTLAFECGITDRYGNDELWGRVRHAMGGHVMLKYNDEWITPLSGSTEYPVALLGIKDDGKVLITTLTSASGERHGLCYENGMDLVDELGYNSVFFLDGGGSTTIVTLEDGTYSERCEHWKAESDYRAIINMAAVVLYDEPICEAQGELDYVETKLDLSDFPASYIPPDLIPYITWAPLSLEGEYDESTGAYILTATNASIDPMISFDLSEFDSINADEYKYMVLLLRSSRNSGSAGIFYYADKHKAASADRYRAAPLGTVWQYSIIDLSEAADWRGKINGFRFDPYDNTEMKSGEKVYIGGITFCKTLEEAEWACGGWRSEGTYLSYAEYLAAKDPVSTPNTEKTPTDDISDIQKPKVSYLPYIIGTLAVAVIITAIVIKRKKDEHH